MAYIEKEVVKEIRKKLRKEFSDYKVSVRCEDYSSVAVTLVSGKNDLGMEYEQLNHYYPNSYENDYVRKFIDKSVEVIVGIAGPSSNRTAGDMGGYDDSNYYVRLQIGEWDKPYRQVA
jgi:hypothetical protein